MEKTLTAANENNFSSWWKVSKKEFLRCKYLYLIFFIPFTYYIMFHYIPMYGVTIAFKDFNIMEGISGSPWVGLKHYKVLLSELYFWKVLRNTLLLNIFNLVFSFPAPIILALMLNEVTQIKLKKTIQTITYLPYFISTVVLCGMVVNFLSSDGIFNQLAATFGYGKTYFLMEPKYFRTIYIASGIWQGIGWNSIIYMAALTGIDVQLYEAATMDGANRWGKFTSVTLPGIMPTIAIMFILSVGQIMTVSFEKILLLYNGSTYETADVIATYVYRRGMIDNDFSYATAAGMFQAVIGFFFLITANKFSKKLNGNGLW